MGEIIRILLTDFSGLLLFRRLIFLTSEISNIPFSLLEERMKRIFQKVPI